MKNLCIIFFIFSVITHIFSLGKVDDNYVKNYLNSLENVEIIQINNKEDFTSVTNNIFSFNYEENNPNYSIIMEKDEVKKSKVKEKKSSDKDKNMITVDKRVLVGVGAAVVAAAATVNVQ